MKIELKNGYVLMRENITRKIAREFNKIFSEGAVYDENMDMKGVTAENIDKADEFLVLSLVEKVVMTDAEGKETYADPTQDWLDNLDAKEYKRLEVQALKVKNSENDEVKK